MFGIRNLREPRELSQPNQLDMVGERGFEPLTRSRFFSPAGNGEGPEDRRKFRVILSRHLSPLRMSDFELRGGCGFCRALPESAELSC
jgi:hypothetical protein